VVFAAPHDTVLIADGGLATELEARGTARFTAVRVARDTTGKPVIVYPNSGEEWDGAGRTWVGKSGWSADLAPSLAESSVVVRESRVDP
jgi:S-methylmethionine-dependent homocysteine/selenocysteine methylase